METPIFHKPEESIPKTKELSDLEKLDEVLKYLNTIKYPDTFRSFEDLQKIFNELLSDTELYLILNKLVKDGNITTYDAVVRHVRSAVGGMSYDENESRYMMTYDGRILINNDGYTREKEQSENKIKRNEANDDRLSYGTILLAIGTFGIVFVELLRLYLEFQ